MSQESAIEWVECKGRRYPLMPGQYWHLAHPEMGFVLHNAFLYEGLIASMSFVRNSGGPEGANSLYGFRTMVDEKEQLWEALREQEHPQWPSRRGAYFLFDDKTRAQTAREEWFPGEDRHLIETRVLIGSRMHRADAKWLDSVRDDWEASARRYWTGDMTDDPSPEILVEGAVYFPGWQSPPFGFWAGLPKPASK